MAQNIGAGELVCASNSDECGETSKRSKEQKTVNKG